MDLLDQRFDFSGAKIALLCGEEVLTILRDDKPDIPFPNMWELAGGECVIIMTGANSSNISRVV